MHMKKPNMLKPLRPYDAPDVEQVDVRLDTPLLQASADSFTEDEEFSFFNS